MESKLNMVYKSVQGMGRSTESNWVALNEGILSKTRKLVVQDEDEIEENVQGQNELEHVKYLRIWRGNKGEYEQQMQPQRSQHAFKESEQVLTEKQQQLQPNEQQSSLQVSKEQVMTPRTRYHTRNEPQLKDLPLQQYEQQKQSLVGKKPYKEQGSCSS